MAKEPRKSVMVRLHYSEYEKLKRLSEKRTVAAGGKPVSMNTIIEEMIQKAEEP